MYKYNQKIKPFLKFIGYLFLISDLIAVYINPTIQIGDKIQIQKTINHLLSDSNIGLLWISVISIRKVRISPIK